MENKDLEFQKAIVKQYEKLKKKCTKLFVVDLNKDELYYEHYLKSFTSEENPIFRTKQLYDCNCCKSFIKKIGGVVGIIDNKMVSIWDIDDAGSDTFNTVAKNMSKYVHKHKISNVYLSSEIILGKDVTYATNKNGDLETYYHWNLELKPSDFSYGSNIPTKLGKFKTFRDLFTKSLEKITINSIDTVLELISQNSIYRGYEFKDTIEKFRSLLIQYNKLNCNEKELFAWRMATIENSSVLRIANSAIGTILLDLSNDVDLETAVSSYERIMSPENYKRPKSIFTKKMLEDAKEKVKSLGFEESLERRHATIDDISVNDIIFVNKNCKSKLRDDIWGDMESSVAKNPKKFNKVEEIGIEKFLSDVVPMAESIELYLQNEASNNLVSLIAPKNKDSKTMFKWDNNFSWSYNGNVADSMIKKNVEKLGGKTAGVLRFSIMWNESGRQNSSDLDAHCVFHNNDSIYFGQKKRHGGELDVDVIQPSGIAVENIIFEKKDDIPVGNMTFLVKQFSKRAGSKNGFKAEIELDGNVYSYDIQECKTQYHIAKIYFDGTNFTISHEANHSVRCEDMWSLKANDFVQVNTIMLSPNYWNKSNGSGNKHYFFMLEGCVRNCSANAFYNEFLTNELIEHKKVFESLGSRIKIEKTENQLSGLGFSSTVRNNVFVKVKGATEKILKILF